MQKKKLFLLIIGCLNIITLFLGNNFLNNINNDFFKTKDNNNLQNQNLQTITKLDSESYLYFRKVGVNKNKTTIFIEPNNEKYASLIGILSTWIGFISIRLYSQNNNIDEYLDKNIFGNFLYKYGQQIFEGSSGMYISLFSQNRHNSDRRFKKNNELYNIEKIKVYTEDGTLNTNIIGLGFYSNNPKYINSGFWKKTTII